MEHFYAKPDRNIIRFAKLIAFFWFTDNVLANCFLLQKLDCWYFIPIWVNKKSWWNIVYHCEKYDSKNRRCRGHSPSPVWGEGCHKLGGTTQYSDVTYSVFQTDYLFCFLILTHPSPVSTLLCFNEYQKCVNDFKLDRCL